MKNNLIAITLLGLLSALTFSTFSQTALADPPTVTTLAATGVTSTNATINGTVNPSGANTYAYLEYGLTTNYGNIGEFTTLPASTNISTLPGFMMSSIAAPAGALWTQTGAPTNLWQYFASSYDGTMLAAVADRASIWTSTNSGINWSQTSSPNTNRWLSIASSADGTQLFSADGAGGVWTSTNSGVTWAKTTAPNSGFWGISSSADGSILAAVAPYVGIFTSTNSGVTWNQTTAPIAVWETIAMSPDATQLTAGVYGGGIWTSSGAKSALTPATTYHYRLVGINSTGTGLGGDLTFTTSTAAPAVNTLAASSITASNATLNGNVNPNGAAATAYFQYGLTTNYGSLTASTNLAATNTAFSISNLITNLTTRTLYHYQLVASNSLGITLGNDATFIYQPAPFNLSNVSKLSGGVLQMSFTNLGGFAFTVLGSTNLALPLTNWTVIGPAVESPAGSGNYQFTDTQNTNQTTQYYRVRSP